MKRIIFILSVLGVGMAQTSAVAGSYVLGQSPIFGSSDSGYTYPTVMPNPYSNHNRRLTHEELSQMIDNLGGQAKQKEDQRVAQPVPETLSDMKKWAEQGNVDYQIKVGWIYYDGEGVRQDLVFARRMFQKAADKGDARGQAALAFFYENGLGGLRQNRATAKELFGKTCDKGFQRGCDEYRRLNQRGY